MNKKKKHNKPAKNVNVSNKPAVADKPVASLADVRQVAPPQFSIPADVDQMPLTAEDADKIRSFEQKVAVAKIQLADLEIQINDQVAKKNELLLDLKSAGALMIHAVNTIAATYGIDVNSQDGRKWNLNTSEMVFREIR